MGRRFAAVFGLTGQVIEFYPPEATEGVPSAATCTVYRGGQSNDEDAELAPAVTIDSTSITLSGTSGYAMHSGAGGRKRLTLPNVSGLATRRRYLLQNGNQQREVVRLAEVSASSLYADVEYDLAYDYPLTVSSLLGLRMTWTVDATWVADEANLSGPASPYRVLWQYTVAGAVRRHWTLLDLVRQARQHGVTADSLLGDWPSLLYQIGPDDRVYAAERAIASAWDRVSYDLEMAGLDPDALRDSGKLDMLVREASLEVFARQGEAPANRDLEQWVRETSAIYKRDLEKAIAGNRLLRAEGTDSAISTDPPSAGWFTS